ncbi:DUF4113 domain-containing protein [Limnohabitans sp. DM1]|uniref:DUF4113 domain-containing protein n=1 Tax=Limnohabitans sp. DM1 TaxID=1597955 RepID=UPI000AE56EDF|nr:DUF4113 domain-containing protein [Limnohabitans sp. DM1]
MLMDLQPATREQLTLDFDETMPENRVRLMLAMDAMNQRYGRGTLKLACVGPRGRSNCGLCGKRTRPALSPTTGQACSRCIWMLNAPAGRRHPPHKVKAGGHSYNP